MVLSAFDATQSNTHTPTDLTFDTNFLEMAFPESGEHTTPVYGGSKHTTAQIGQTVQPAQQTETDNSTALNMIKKLSKPPATAEPSSWSSTSFSFHCCIAWNNNE